jgi:glycosyltransferase involved in cell wall biosynthesis
MNCKILFVIHKMGYGGAEKIMAFLANRFALDGNNVYLLTYEDMNRMQNLVSEVKHIGLPKSSPSFFAIRRIHQIIQIRNVLSRIEPDVLISFLTYPNMISIIASMRMRILVIISERGDPHVFQSWFTRFRDFIYNFSDGYVFQTNGAKNYFSQSIQAKAIVIPNPVISNSIPPKWMGDKEDIVVNVGRFELKQKRQDILIKAFARIADKYPNIKLMLFGDGEDEFRIKEIISNYHLQERIVLAGVTKNICEAIKKANLFVLSSDYEGMPNALIEAMCVGLPCVSTDCSPGGAAELIKHMENGILVKRGHVEELANAMDFMLSNPKAAEFMGQNALKIKGDLSSKIIINQWEKYINHQVATRSSKDNKQ